MKIFGVLAGGWIVGGGLILLLSGPGIAEPKPTAVRSSAVPAVTIPLADRGSGMTRAITTPAPRADSASAVLSAPRYSTPGGVTIPVVGITPRDLKDTFHEARGGGRVHRAIDILAPRGTPVVAAVDGTIRKLFTSRAGGVTIYQFDRNDERVYYYAHLDRYADTIAEGMFVRQGTVVGYVGTTGNAPPATPHLHFSIEELPPTKEWWKGSPVNPFPILATASPR